MPTHLLARPRRLGRLVVTLLTLAVAATPAAAAELLYAPEPAADAIHDAGVTTALRQAPIADITNPRWPAAKQIGKVSGNALSKLGPNAMVRTLRENWQRHAVGGPVGGHVGVDEIRPSDWDARAAANLASALKKLGPDAERVFIYVSPAVVERVGRTDPRSELGDLDPVFRALTSAGRTYLEVYRGDLSPFPPREMATHLTRWLQRWPAGRQHALRVLIGPGGSVGQTEIWNRIRATPAGRQILRNGPGYYGSGKATAADGAAWAAEYARFRANPDAPPPGGDFAVPEGGGVVVIPPKSVVKPGGAIQLTTNRPGAAVVRLVSATGKVRIIKGSLKVGTSGNATIVLPTDIRPGQYRISVTFQGEGLKDQVVIPVRIGRQSSSGGGTVRPGFRERLLEGQRVAQEAVRLLNAIDAWLEAGVTTGDLAPGAFGGSFLRGAGTPAFGPGLALTRADAPAADEPLAPRPIVPKPGKGGAGNVQVSAEQLLINQRISQAAVMRANAIEKRLDAGLTGGDLLPGAVTPGKLVNGLRVMVTAEAPVPARSESKPGRISRRSARGLKVTSEQLSINLRISRAALARAQALAARLTAGLTESDFRPGSIVAANIAPEARVSP